MIDSHGWVDNEGRCKGGAGFSLVELKVQDLNQFRTQISYRLREETPPF